MGAQRAWLHDFLIEWVLHASVRIGLGVAVFLTRNNDAASIGVRTAATGLRNDPSTRRAAVRQIDGMGAYSGTGLHRVQFGWVVEAAHVHLGSAINKLTKGVSHE